MAKNWGRLVLFAAAAGAAAAGTYYYLQKHKKAADPECEAYDGDAAADDDFEDDDFFDDDFEDEEEDCEKKDTSRIFTAGTNAQGHTYVTLDLKAASDKAANLCDNVATKFGEAVQKLKNSSEYEAVSGKVSETVDKIKNSEEFQAVDEQVENALHKVREMTSRTADTVSDGAQAVENAAKEVLEAAQPKAEDEEEA